MSGTSWAGGVGQWDRVVSVLRERGICGLDTETYGHDISETTAPHRARVHVWSVATLTGSLHPRGHFRATGCVLPAAALDYRPIRDVLEDPSVVKVAHNAPHDVHALANIGIRVAGWVDSLGRARVVFPGEARHGLKSLCAKVGRKLSKYEDVLTMEVDVGFKARRCPCGNEKCGRKTAGHGKVDTTVYRSLPRLQPLESVVEGHPLWGKLVAYAAEDAITALELWSLMDKVPDFTAPDPGWSPS